MYHGYGNLDKAIEFLDINDREILEILLIRRYPLTRSICFFVNLATTYSIITIVFYLIGQKNAKRVWLDESKDYGQIRIYAFLAERFLSYWFKKNSNFNLWPIKHFEI